MEISERRRRVDPTPPTTAPVPPSPVVAPTTPRRGMSEERARRHARDRNADRKPGEPIWTAYPLDVERRSWDYGTVEWRIP